jgi:hypothetical protein
LFEDVSLGKEKVMLCCYIAQIKRGWSDKDNEKYIYIDERKEKRMILTGKHP